MLGTVCSLYCTRHTFIIWLGWKQISIYQTNKLWQCLLIIILPYTDAPTLISLSDRSEELSSGSWLVLNLIPWFPSSIGRLAHYKSISTGHSPVGKGGLQPSQALFCQPQPNRGICSAFPLSSSPDGVSHSAPSTFAHRATCVHTSLESFE